MMLKNHLMMMLKNHLLKNDALWAFPQIQLVHVYVWTVLVWCVYWYACMLCVYKVCVYKVCVCVWCVSVYESFMQKNHQYLVHVS